MKLISVSALLLVVIGCVDGTSWSWTFDFGDRGHQQSRRLLIDLLLENTLLITPDAAIRTGNSTYDPKLFPDFRHTDKRAAFHFDNKRNAKSMEAFGIYGSDLVARSNYNTRPLRRNFVLVDDVRHGDPTMDADRKLYAGRVAMIGNSGNVNTGFRDSIFEGVVFRLLCGSSVCDDDEGYRTCSTTMTVGAAPSKRIITVPSRRIFWQIQTQGWSMGDAKNFTRGVIELAPTSSDIVMPRDHLDMILDDIGAYTAREGGYNVPCWKRSDAHPLIIRVASQTLTIKPTEYIEPSSGDSLCRLRMRAGDVGSQFWVVGTPLTESVGACLHYSTGAVTFFQPERPHVSIKDADADFAFYRPNNFTQQTISRRKLR